MDNLGRMDDSPLGSPPSLRGFARRRPFVVLTFVAITLTVYSVMVVFVSYDVKYYFSKWVDYIQANGYWKALADPFHLYTGPNIYVLAALTYMDPFLSDLVIIKLTPILGVVAATPIVHQFARRYADPAVPPPVATALFLLLPTVPMNAAQWGQSEIFFTACLIISLFCLLQKKPVLGVLFFGLSISFKLQAMFFAPFLLFMMLRQRVNLAYLALVPVFYVAANVGLLLAGRPFEDVLLIYVRQGAYVDVLSAGAPNPWLLVREGLDALGGQGLADAMYGPLTVVGLALAGVAGLSLAWLGWRRVALEPYQLMALATLSVAAMPYLLPKMHDRYFFAADVFSFLLAIMKPSSWRIAVCFQVGSGLIYIDAFYGPELGPVVQSAFNGLAILTITAGIALLVRLVAAAFTAHTAPRAPHRDQVATG